MTNPHPTGSDASVTEAMVEDVAEFLCDEMENHNPYVGAHWPLDARDDGQREGGFVHIQPIHIVEKYRDDARRLLRHIAALSLPTPKGKHIEDVYPDEAVAWRVIGGGAAGSTAITAEPDFAAAWRVNLNVEPLYPPSVLSAARQQGVLEGAREERDRCANKAREYAGHYPEGSDGRNTFVILADWIELGAPAAIRGAA